MEESNNHTTCSVPSHSRSNELAYSDLLQQSIPLSIVQQDLKSWKRWMRALKATVRQAKALQLQSTIQQEYEVIKNENKREYWGRIQNLEEWVLQKGTAKCLDDSRCCSHSLGEYCFYRENKDRIGEYYGVYRLKGQDQVYLCDACMNDCRNTDKGVRKELFALYDARDPGKGEDDRDQTLWDEIVGQEKEVEGNVGTKEKGAKEEAKEKKKKEGSGKGRRTGKGEKKNRSPECKECGKPCVSKMSNTAKNPGRLFWGCNNGCRIWNGWQE